MPQKKAKTTKKSVSFLQTPVSPVLILPLALLVFVVVYSFTIAIYSTGIKDSLSNQKDAVEGTVKTKVAPLKIAELKVKAKKSEITLALISEEVGKNDIENALKNSTVLRGDLEDIYRDLISQKETNTELSDSLKSMLKSQTSNLKTAQSKAKASDSAALKLELSLTQSLQKELN